MYDEKKIEEFNKSTIEDYNQSLRVENIARVNPVKKTDGSFIQVGIRPILDAKMLLPDNPPATAFDPRLPSAGRIVAVGEEEFLIDSLLKNNKMKVIEFKEDIREFPKHVFDFNDAIILISTKFYVEIFTKLINRIDYDNKYPRLDRRYRIDTIPEKILGNNIIIIDKNAILWEKELFYNEFTKKDEKLDIKIKPKSVDKVDITIRSVNKIKYLNLELIKILEIKE